MILDREAFTYYNFSWESGRFLFVFANAGTPPKLKEPLRAWATILLPLYITYKFTEVLDALFKALSSNKSITQRIQLHEATRNSS